MIRVSLLITIALFLHGNSAKPHSSLVKVGENRHQETLKIVELPGKMSLGMKEVEPPEDMAVTDDDIDPDMAIWKAVQWTRGRKNLVAEDDRDDLHHPPLSHVLEAKANAGPEVVSWNDPPIKPYQQAEPDTDDLSHNFPGSEAQEAKEDTDHRYLPNQQPGNEPQVEQPQPRRRVYTQPEQDRDELYHRYLPDQRPRKEPQVEQPQPRRRLYTQPEQDRDELYHRYLPDQQPRKEPQVEQLQPRVMVYTQPERDRDVLYHGDMPDQHVHPQPQVQPVPLGHIAYTQPEEDRDHLYHN